MQRTVIIWMRDRSPDQRQIGMAAGDTGRWTRRKHAEKVNTADRCAPNHCATITATNLCESSKIHLLERKTQRQRVSRPPPPPNRYCHINPFKCNPSPSTQRRMNSRPKVASHDRIASGMGAGQRGRLDEPTQNVTKLCISGSAAENKS